MKHALLSPLRFLPLDPFQLSLSTVLVCGQTFRWRRGRATAATLPRGTSSEQREQLHEWSYGHRDRTIVLRQDGQGIHYRSLFRSSDAAAHAEDLQHDTTLAFIRRYFALDVSLPELYSFWSARDPNFAKKTASGTRYGGIRILRQPAWECLIEFICSSNNNIARIEGMVKRFSQLYGQRLPAPSEVEQLGQGLEAEDTSNAKPELDEGTGLAPPTTKAEDLANPLELEEAEEVYSFPRPQDLLGEGTTAALRAAGFGYRDAYVAKTAALVCELATEAGQGNELEAWLESISALSEQDAREALLRFSGVGPKVADCILLFGLGFGEVVPVDTHVYQIAVRDYGLKGSRDATVNRAMYAKVNDKLRGVWGDKAGWAHQILFTADLRSLSDHVDPLLVSESASVVKSEQTWSAKLEEETDVKPVIEPKVERPLPAKRARTSVASYSEHSASVHGAKHTRTVKKEMNEDGTVASATLVKQTAFATTVRVKSRRTVNRKENA